MRKILRKRPVIAALLLVASQLGLLGASAVPANADIYNCQTGFSSVGAWAYCSSGSSTYFRVNVVCGNWFGHYVATGPWRLKGGGSPSTVDCGFGYEYGGQPWASGS